MASERHSLPWIASQIRCQLGSFHSSRAWAEGSVRASVRSWAIDRLARCDERREDRAPPAFLSIGRVRAFRHLLSGPSGETLGTRHGRGELGSRIPGRRGRSRYGLSRGAPHGRGRHGLGVRSRAGRDRTPLRLQAAPADPWLRAKTSCSGWRKSGRRSAPYVIRTSSTWSTRAEPPTALLTT